MKFFNSFFVLAKLNNLKTREVRTLNKSNERTDLLEDVESNHNRNSKELSNLNLFL